VLGDSVLEPTPLVGDLDAVIDQIDPDEALQRLIAQSPEMAVALTEVERARWAIDRAYAEPVPNIDVQAILQSDNGTGSSNGNLQVSMPIPWLNRNQGGIRQAHAELVAAERGVGQLELSLKRRLASVYQRYASARNQVRDYSKPEGILANSQTTLELVRRGYQSDEFSYVDLLTAQRTYFQSNLTYIEAQGELWAAVLEIEGLLLKDSLESTNFSAP
jgi:cobalt-zinc-cadmium efflux system outer membrane protein